MLIKCIKNASCFSSTFIFLITNIISFAIYYYFCFHPACFIFHLENNLCCATDTRRKTCRGQEAVVKLLVVLLSLLTAKVVACCFPYPAPASVCSEPGLCRPRQHPQHQPPGDPPSRYQHLQITSKGKQTNMPVFSPHFRFDFFSPDTWKVVNAKIASTNHPSARMEQQWYSKMVILITHCHCGELIFLTEFLSAFYLCMSCFRFISIQNEFQILALPIQNLS